MPWLRGKTVDGLLEELKKPYIVKSSVADGRASLLWRVLCVLESLQAQKNPNVTQGYCTKEELKHLVDGKVITKDTQTELTFDEGDRTIDDLWNVSFATGFLPIRVFWKMVDTILPSPAAECGKCSSDRFRNVSSTW